MMKPGMSPAAAGLLRAILRRGGVDRNRILLTDLRSTDWHSLTFAGERHCIALRIPGPGASEVARMLTEKLDEAELSIGGHIVADILALPATVDQADGAIYLTIEALTVED
jgi:hypothetical protein